LAYDSHPSGVAAPDVSDGVTPRGTSACHTHTLDPGDNKRFRERKHFESAPLSLGMGDDSRGPSRSVSDAEILDVFEAAGDPVLSTAEVTEQVSLSRRSVYNYLNRLEESGDLESKTVGGRATVWWQCD